MNKKNLPLVIAFCIPVVMIVLVAAFIYLPSIGKKPAHNFLYASGNNYYPGGGGEYTVSGGHLVFNQPPANPNNYPYPKTTFPTLYVYDVTSGKSTDVTFADAQKYNLDSSVTSEDGYRVERGNSGGGDLFFGGGSSDYNSWFLKGHNRSIKLNLKLTGQDYYSMQFLGWVMN